MIAPWLTPARTPAVASVAVPPAGRPSGPADGSTTMQGTRVITDRRGWRGRRHSIRGISCFLVVLAMLSVGGWTGRSAAVATPRGGGGAVPLGSLHSALSDYLATRGQAEHMSAVGLRVSFPGHEPSVNMAVGTTRYGGGALVSTSALWQIGSNTKAVTSVMLLQLEAGGRLSINDTLGKWLPQYPAWRNITIKRLLNMTSGIADYLDQPAFLRVVAAAPNTQFSAARLVSYVTGVPLEKAGWHYSNTNYILAQMIIERVTHDTYADQLMRRIIIPLGLRSMCDAPYTCPAAAAARMPGRVLLRLYDPAASIAAR